MTAELLRQYGHRYIFKSREGENIFSSIEAMYTDGEDIDINKLADSLDEQTMAVFRNIVDNVYLGGKDQEILEELVLLPWKQKNSGRDMKR